MIRVYMFKVFRREALCPTVSELCSQSRCSRIWTTFVTSHVLNVDDNGNCLLVLL